jgi:hypothetical protein
MKTEQIIDELVVCLESLTRLEKEMMHPKSVWYCSTAARQVLEAGKMVQNAMDRCVASTERRGRRDEHLSRGNLK